MKVNSKIFLKTIGAIVMILALTFSTNTHATNSSTFGGGNSSWFGGDNNKKHKKNYNLNTRNKNDDDSSDDNGKDEHGQGDSIPLDGGLSILLIGAAAFGVKKLRGNKNEEI